MKLNERHCTLCETEGREQIGGIYIVACKQQDCCNLIADETEADAYVAQLEATNERLYELYGMFIEWANITVIRAHMEYDDPRDERAWRGTDWRGELASAQYDIWEKLTKHVQEAIENYERDEWKAHAELNVEVGADWQRQYVKLEKALQLIASRHPGNWRQKIAIEALGGKPEKCYTLKEIKDTFFPNRDLDSLRSEIGVSPDTLAQPQPDRNQLNTGHECSEHGAKLRRQIKGPMGKE